MKLLLVRLTSMGDLIHTLPAITDLSRHCSDIELHWLCEASFADIARLHPFVAHIHTVRWRSWRKQLGKKITWQELSYIKKYLCEQQFDMVLDSQGLLKSAFFARWGRAPICGLDWQSARERLASLFYQRTFHVKKGEDAIWRNRQLFAQVFDYMIEGLPDFGVEMPQNISGSLQNLPEHYYHVALHATSRASKLWSIEHWLSLLNQMHQTDRLPIFLTWGNDAERQRAEAIAQALPFAHVCPALTLLQAADLLAKAQSVVGVDTGLLHLANAVNSPVVGIYTDSDPSKTGLQTNAWSANLGGIGQKPSPETVFNTLQHCIQAKHSGSLKP